MNGFNDIELTGDSSKAVQPPTPPTTTSAEGPGPAAQGDSILNILANVEAQLDRLRSAQGDQDDQLATLEARARVADELERDLALRRAELDERETALEALESELAERATGLESRDASLRGREEQARVEHDNISKAASQMKRQAEEIAQARNEIASQRARLEQTSTEVEQERRRLEALAQELEGRAKTQDAELARARIAVEQARQEAARAIEDRNRGAADHAQLTHRVDQAESNVGELIRKLEESQSALEAARTELAAAHERASDLDLKLDESREQLDTAQSALREKSAQLRALTERATKLSEQVEQLMSQVERESGSSGQLQERLTDLESKLKSRDGALSAAIDAAKQAEAEGLALAEQADEARAEAHAKLTAALAELKETRERAADADAMRGRLEAARRELAQIQDESERELSRAKVRLEAMQDEMRQAREQAGRDRHQAEEAARQVGQKLADVEHELAALRTAAQQGAGEVESLRASLQERDHTIARQEETLRSAKAKLTKFAEAIGEQAEQIQRGADAIAAVREQKKQIDRLKEQLAAAMLAGNPEELTRRDERIKELTEALRQARGQSLTSGDGALQSERVQSLQNEVDSLKTELERSRIELGEARTAAERTHREAPPRNDVEIAALNARITELEAQLAAAQTQPAQGGSSAAAADLKQKAVRVRQMAEHLRRRRARLARVKTLLEERAAAPLAGPADASPQEKRAQHAENEQKMQLAARIQRDREVLNEAARCLAQSERAMIRKWARPRAIAMVGWLVLLSIAAALVSWFAADAIFPATRTASLHIEAGTRPGTELSPAQATAWQQWHTGLLADSNFHRALASRFEERQMSDLVNADRVAELLESSLTIDAVGDSEFVLTLSGTDEKALPQILDTIGVTMASESRRQQGARIDGARAELVGERSEQGRVVYATLNSKAVDDQRLVRALFIFLGTMGGLFLLAVICYGSLIRSRGVFQSSEFNIGD